MTSLPTSGQRDSIACFDSALITILRLFVARRHDATLDPGGQILFTAEIHQRLAQLFELVDVEFFNLFARFGRELADQSLEQSHYQPSLALQALLQALLQAFLQNILVYYRFFQHIALLENL